MIRLLGLCLLAVPALAGPVVVVEADKPAGKNRPLHGVNGGPTSGGGLIDVSADWKRLAPPSARLHDCHWPTTDVVDLHVLFPNPDADPADPKSYDFSRTDPYIAAVVATGADIVFRLGENIEHEKVRQHVHPPKDMEKWARACVGVVRHYTEGWANGFKHPIRRWEIWNEPDNRPAMWSGTDEDYLRLYAVTAKAIRAACPTALVGGPGLGNSGTLKGEVLEAPPFVGKFLAHCKKEGAPLDFFSWHCYTNDPGEFAKRAVGVRRILDTAGYLKCESHLNEWNYLPDNSWTGVKGPTAKDRERWNERIGSAEGAAFAAAALMRMQDAPIDTANYFTAEPGGMGLFNYYGVPRKTYHAFVAVASLGSKPGVAVTTDLGITARAGNDGRELVIVMARSKGDEPVTLDIRGISASRYTVSIVDVSRDLSETAAGTYEKPLKIEMKAPAVAVVRLRRD